MPDDYEHRLAALLSELADCLVELNNLLRVDTHTKDGLRPIGTDVYNSGWSDGWDDCAAAVMGIVQGADKRIKQIEYPRRNKKKKGD